MSSPESTPSQPESPVVTQTVNLVLDAYDEALSANWLTDPEAIKIIDSTITSAAILAIEITLAHLRQVATPEEQAALATLRQRAGI